MTDKNAILGTIGGMKHIGAVTTTDMEREFMLLEQAGALLEEQVDGLLLETFTMNLNYFMPLKYCVSKRIFNCCAISVT